MNRIPVKKKNRILANNQALLVLNTVVFLMSFGFYILYPLLANYLISWRKIAALSVTLIINVRVVAQDALMFPVSIILDRTPAHKAVAIGGIARGIGFFLFSLTDNLPLLLIASLLTGVGGALFFPAMYALYMRYSNKENLMAFARRERINSLGAVLGPIAGMLLNRKGFLYVGITSAFIFFLASAFLLVMMSKEAVSCTLPQRKTRPLSMVLKNTPFLFFAVASMLITQISNQMGLSTAVRIDQIDPSYRYIGILSSLSSMVIVLLQVPVLGTLNAKLRPSVLLMLSVFLFSVGYLTMGFFSALPAVYAGTFFISFGVILYVPTRDAMLSVYADDNPATYYGFIGVLNTFGSLILASALGKLYDLSYRPEFRYLPWLSLAAAGIVAVVILIAIDKTNRKMNGTTGMKGEEDK